MQVQLDFQSKIPIYTQIVEQVTGLVTGGALRPGDQLPTVREMAADLRINFNTVARAYRLLHEARIISTQQGRGTYVLGPPPAGESTLLRRQRLQGMVESWLVDAARLGYGPDEIAKAWGDGFAEWIEGQQADNTRTPVPGKELE